MASHTRPGISTHWRLYCLLNSLLRQTLKKTSSWAFVRGTPAMESPHTGPPKFNSSDPLQRVSTGDQKFRRIQGQRCHQLLDDKLHSSNIIWVSWVFDSLASPLFVQQPVWTNMKEDIKASVLLWWGLEQMETPHPGPAMWKRFTKHQRSTSLRNALIKQHSSALLIVCTGIRQWALDSPHIGPAIKKI